MHMPIEQPPKPLLLGALVAALALEDINRLRHDRRGSSCAQVYRRSASSRLRHRTDLLLRTTQELA